MNLERKDEEICFNSKKKINFHLEEISFLKKSLFFLDCPLGVGSTSASPEFELLNQPYFFFFFFFFFENFRCGVCFGVGLFVSFLCAKFWAVL